MVSSLGPLHSKGLFLIINRHNAYPHQYVCTTNQIANICYQLQKQSSNTCTYLVLESIFHGHIWRLLEANWLCKTRGPIRPRRWQTWSLRGIATFDTWEVLQRSAGYKWRKFYVLCTKVYVTHWHLTEFFGSRAIATFDTCIVSGQQVTWKIAGKIKC